MGEEGIEECNCTTAANCSFLGYEMINHMVLIGLSETRIDAVRLGKDLARKLHLFHLVDGKNDKKQRKASVYTFSDDARVYKFRSERVQMIEKRQHNAKNFEESSSSSMKRTTRKQQSSEAEDQSGKNETETSVLPSAQTKEDKVMNATMKRLR